MKLTVNGDIKNYYVQMLCMIFFPGAKFSESEIYNENTPEVITDIRKDGNYYIGYASMKAHGKTETAVYSVDASQYTSDMHERARKIAVGGAVFNAGCRLFGHTPPWGILIGVRPSKVAMNFLDSGLDYNQTVKKLCDDFFVSYDKAKLTSDVALYEKKVIEKYSDPKFCSIYISIPFCPSRCDYCSFISYTTKGFLQLIPDYIIQLKKDIENTFRLINELGMKVATIYIGGGTPTTLNESQLDELLTQIEKCTDVSSLYEYTLEAGRPDTITAEKLRSAKIHGVNRISVNTQTLNDTILEKIGRKHTADDFFRSFATARNSGIECINTDLIAGLPDETYESFASSIDKVIDLRPDNITIHTFSVKKSAEILQKNKEIYSGKNIEAEKCINYSQKILAKNGYYPYYMYKQKNTTGNLENTGFSFPGCEGLYNIFMMEEIHSIFAVGAGAVTKYLKHGENGNIEIERIFSPKYPYEYLRNSDISDISKISEQEEAYKKQKKRAESFFN